MILWIMGPFPALFALSLSLATPELCQKNFSLLAREASPFVQPFAATHRAQYERYLSDSVAGLNAMRGENGLVRDTVLVKQEKDGSFAIEDYNPAAAPTDAGLDLLVQLELARDPRYRANAIKAADRILATLNRLPYHKDTGLFYRLYDTRRDQEMTPLSQDVSSVDNMHLSLALWTAAEEFKGEPIGKAAEALFKRADYSAFYDPASGLIGGNLKHTKDGGASTWTLEDYRYHFGSEARSVYLLGYALGLFKSPDSVLEEALRQVPIETNGNGKDKMLAVWDGGVFQALLPRTLLNEELYSRNLARSAKNLSRNLLAQGGPLPPAYSASVINVGRDSEGKTKIDYSGKLGYAPLKSPSNPDAIDSNVVPSHGVLLSSAVSPASFSERLRQMERIGSPGNRIYLPGFGFVVSARVENGNATPNSAGVGVDKGIEVLSLLQMLDPEGLSPSGRALQNSEPVRKRLEKAYGIIESRWPE